MICSECGNILVHGCGPVCLACADRACRANVVESQARGLAAALDAVYAAISPMPQAEQDAILTVADAQVSLSARIRNPEHNRERPNWDEIDAEQAEEERERNTCGLCCGTGLIMGKHCLECWSED